MRPDLLVLTTDIYIYIYIYIYTRSDVVSRDVHRETRYDCIKSGPAISCSNFESSPRRVGLYDIAVRPSPKASVHARRVG